MTNSAVASVPTITDRMLTFSIRAKQTGDKHGGHDDLSMARRAHAIAGDGDAAEHAEKQRERDTDLPAVEQPVGQRDARGGGRKRHQQRASGSDFEIGRGRDRHGFISLV